MTKWLLILCGTLAGCAHGKRSLASATQAQTLFIVNAAYASESRWTESEIRERFGFIQALFAQTCEGVRIELGEVLSLGEPELQNLKKSIDEETVLQMQTILAKFKTPRRPTFLYVGKMEGSRSHARAYLLGGPRRLTKFSGSQFFNDPRYEHNPTSLDAVPPAIGQTIHGTVVIADGISRASLPTYRPVQRLYITDAHELGHVLLNDTGHRLEDLTNLMSTPNENSLKLTPTQCEVIRAYNEEEATREHP